MKTKMSAKRILLSAVMILLCVLLTLSFCACKKEETKETPKKTISASGDEVVVDEYADVWADATYTEDTVLGEGERTFYFEVQVGSHSVTFTVNTDASTVGDALLDLGVIAGEEGSYGLYVKTVNGILADYDVNAAYWGYYQDGEYIMTGVDGTDIENGAHYEMVYTEG